MIFIGRIKNIAIALSLSGGLLSYSPVQGDSFKHFHQHNPEKDLVTVTASDSANKNFEGLGSTIKSLQSENNFPVIRAISDSLIRTISSYSSDSVSLSEIYYYISICQLLSSGNDAMQWFDRTIALKKKLGLIDEHYANCIFNVGVIYASYGENRTVVRYMQEYISVGEQLFGENSSQVASGYSALIGAEADIHDFKNLSGHIFKVIEILGKNPSALTGRDLADLYHNIGIGYTNLGDYSKARIYLERSEDIFIKQGLRKDENYINMVNTMAIIYGNLGLNDQESEYFEKGISLAVSNNSPFSLNMMNTYVINLAKSGDINRGENILKTLVRKSKALYGTNSYYYIEFLRNYADFIMTYKNDFRSSANLFKECLPYAYDHRENTNFYNNVLEGYSESLFREGETEKALSIIQGLLFTAIPEGEKYRLLNPPADSLRSDKNTLSALRLKHEILRNLYAKTPNPEVLEASAGTSELIITIIDRLRTNISEDESRILMGDKYRNSYLTAINDFELCFRMTRQKKYLEKAFEFAERSKVAGLLAATREMNAVQFQVPSDIAEFENSLIREISYCNSVLNTEAEKPSPDKNTIDELKLKLFNAVKARDSLVVTFEKNYPEYYRLKYMNDVPSPTRIPLIIGRNKNYLNYILSDSVLYVFVINRKHLEMEVSRIDSSFMNELREFRYLLSDPNVSYNAGQKFERFRSLSLGLYKKLIDPVKKYFISEELIISPDNLLSYIPFETLITEPYNDNEILYRKLDYLMDRYNISYNYSAAYMEQSGKRRKGKTNNLVAFAPVYPKIMDTDSLFLKRQAGNGKIYDLPYARQEAEYVTDITNGKMYVNNDARESIFKSEAGKYDIVHMAMHTVLNDQNPMNSAMIFTQGADSSENGLLLTSEIYGIPLKARMVVLSSCNSGSGKLSSGEGILSLARGFLYSGSRSVVMSMWEVEDKAGTEIVELFYNHIKNGESKSEALKKSRTEYLKNATQIKSHPYFWATLIVYGDDRALYFPWRRAAYISGIIILISISLIIYFRKPRYS